MSEESGSRQTYSAQGGSADTNWETIGQAGSAFFRDDRVFVEGCCLSLSSVGDPERSARRGRRAAVSGFASGSVTVRPSTGHCTAQQQSQLPRLGCHLDDLQSLRKFGVGRRMGEDECAVRLSPGSTCAAL